MGYVVLVIVAICGATDFGKVFASDDIVCYPQIGCIDNGPPFFDPLLRPIGNLPSTRAEVGTEFLLNTRSNPITPQFLDTNDISTITSSTFDPLKETKIVCHGYTESAYAAWMIEMVAELVNNDDFNIIRINWHKGATAIYGQSTTNTRVVAAEASYLLDVLKSLYGYSADKVHMIGHSLGSHIAGYVGASQQNPKLKRITGLDPAGPYFEDTDIVVRLDPSDATFVDAIHTDTDPLYTTGMGIYMPVAHFDYYVNGGHDQPGCDKGFINHIVVEGAIYQGYPLEFNVFIDDPGFLKGDKEKGNLFITLIGSLQQSERILLTPERFLMYPGEDYTFVAVSDVVTGPIVGAYFEWEYDPDWYKPWDWDLWVNPDIYLHKILIQDSDGTRYTMCGDDNKIQANKDVKTLFAVKDCK